MTDSHPAVLQQSVSHLPASKAPILSFLWNTWEGLERSFWTDNLWRVDFKAMLILSLISRWPPLHLLDEGVPNLRAMDW